MKWTSRETALVARPGFDWGRVKWAGAKEPQPDVCSYCDVILDEDDVPLRMWKPDGSAVAFCDGCAKRWFGVEPVGDD